MKSCEIAQMVEGMLGIMLALSIIDLTRTGGFVAVLEIRNGPTARTPILVARIGEVSQAKHQKYHDFSAEKALRLQTYSHSDGHQHVSSWQSRDPDQDRWGGAILAGMHILSFSGLPELADEALMLAVAVKLRLLSASKAMEIAQLSDNGFYRLIVDKVPLTGENLDAY
jgi:hypothetical protein